MKKTIAFGTLILALSNILSKVLALGRDALLASIGGVSAEVDAYNIAFIIPDLINHFLGAGLMSITLIPLLINHVNQKIFSEKLSEIFLPMVTLVTLVSVSTFIFVPELLPYAVKDISLHSAETISLVHRYTRILIFGQVFYLIGSFFLASQYAHKAFVFPALAPLIYNASIILGGYIGSFRGSLEGFCWGALGGMALGSCILQVYGGFKVRVRIYWPKVWFSPLFKKYLWLTLPFILGMAATFSNEFVYRYFGGEQTGSVASLGFGLRIMMALVGVFGGAVGIASYPFLSKLVKDGQIHKVHDLIIGTLEKIITLLTPIIILLFFWAEPVVNLYLGSGAFNQDHVKQVASFLQIYLGAALPMSMAILVNRCFFAQQNTWLPSLLSFFAFALTMPFYYFYEFLGANKVPWGSNINAILLLLFLLGFWIARNPSKKYWKILIIFLKICIPCTLLGCLANFFLVWGNGLDRLELFLGASVSGAALLGLYFVMLTPLKIVGVDQWRNQLWRKIFKG